MTRRFFLLVFFFFLMNLAGFGQKAADKSYSFADTVRAKQILVEVDSLIKGRNYTSALKKVDKAKQIYTEVLGITTGAVARCWHQIATINFYQENFEEAKNAWETTLSISLSLDSKDHPDIARCYHNLGMVYQDLGRYEIAISNFEKALKIYFESFGESHPDIAKSYNSMGVVYFYQGKIKKTIEYFEKALEIKLSLLGEDDISLAYSYNNLAIINLKLGKLDKSLIYHKKALSLIISAQGKDHPNVAKSYGGIGNVYSRLKKYNVAEKYYKKAITIHLVANKKSPHSLATAYRNLGVLKTDLGKYKDAIENHEKSLKIYKETVDEIHTDVGACYNNLGVAYSRQKKFDIALMYFEKALKIYLEIHGEEHPKTARVYLNAGSVFQEIGNFENAIKYFKDARNALSFSNIESSRKVSSIPDLINILYMTGKLYQERYVKNSDVEFLFQSRDWLEYAIAMLDYQSFNLRIGSKSKLVDDAFTIFSEAAITNILLFETTNNFDYLRESFNFSERVKSYLLYAAMQESNALSYATLPDSILIQEYDLRTSINYYEKQRQQQLFIDQDEMDSIVLEINSLLFDLNKNYEELKINLEINYPEYYRLKYDLSTVNLENVQREMLGANETMLEYFVGDSSIFIYVINQDNYNVHEIKKDFPLEEWVKTFREANNKNSYTKKMKDYCDVANDLYQKLIAPVADDLKDNLIIIPDGILGYLPFEALLVEPVTDNKYQNFHKYHYLIKDKQISYCYSATLLQQMRDQKHKEKAEKDFLAFAPFYDGDTTMLEKLFRYADPKDKKPLAPLPKSGEEVFGIKRIVGGDIYLNEDATEESFVSLASNYRIIHLATHGKANDKVGDYSFLAFTEQKDSIENELLYVRDLYNLQLNADMVVLSACETGIGELQRGEGIISLARGMTYAGAKSIITSLWSVEDGRTKDIMISFYEYLKAGKTKDGALRLAKLDYILDEKNDRSKVHPFYWSGFIGIGDMRPIQF